MSTYICHNQEHTYSYIYNLLSKPQLKDHWFFLHVASYDLQYYTAT